MQRSAHVSSTAPFIYMKLSGINLQLHPKKTRDMLKCLDVYFRLNTVPTHLRTFAISNALTDIFFIYFQCSRDE